LRPTRLTRDDFEGVAVEEGELEPNALARLRGAWRARRAVGPRCGLPFLTLRGDIMVRPPIALCATAISVPSDRILVVARVDKRHNCPQAKLCLGLAAGEATDVAGEVAVADVVGEDGLVVNGAE